jgi:circadian clock protein KaiC
VSEPASVEIAPLTSTPLARTGIEGLDEILFGGLAARRFYLVEGDPGAGKTTLALQFLIEGARVGETGLFVSLSETEAELRVTAESHGWDLDGLHILEIVASEESLRPDSRYTMFHPSEVELGETTKSVLAEADRLRPARLVFDSLSELRLLAENPLRFRRQILALKHHFAKQGATVVVIDDKTSEERDKQLHSLAHGVISLVRDTPEYGPTRRQVEILKMRGRAFRDGRHDFRIVRGGLSVYPRLVASEHRATVAQRDVISGLPALDDLLGGGLASGTSTLVLGAAGTGKSSLASQFACASAARGERAAIFLFDESIETLLTRSASLGIDVATHRDAGRIELRQVDPAELTPGEFAHLVQQSVTEDATKLVVIDTLNGYLNAMPSERFLALHLHELLSFLGSRGVTTILLMTQHGFVGSPGQVPIDASYLADTVLLLRYYEAMGEVRQAISVMKKRTGSHERTIRQVHFNGGLVVGEVIRGFHGVLTGVPQLLPGADGAAAPKA